MLENSRRQQYLTFYHSFKRSVAETPILPVHEEDETNEDGVQPESTLT